MLDFIKAIWPFLSEIFFGGKSIKEVISANKFTTFLIAVLMISLSLNWMALGKIYDIAVARREETKQGVKTNPAAPDTTASAPFPVDKAASSAKSNKSKAEIDEDARKKRLKELFKE